LRPPGRFELMWLHEEAVHLGAAVGETVNFVLAGNANDVLAPRFGGIDLGIQNLFAEALRFGQRLSAGVDDLAAADEFKSSLRSDAIDGDVIHGVLDRPRVDDTGRRTLRSRWPVSGKSNQIGSQNRQRPGSFGK